MRRLLFTSLFLVFLLGSTFLGPAKPVQAADITPSDLIALVNGIRTSYGLPALGVNSILMGTAQWTADEMIRTGIRDHLSYNGYPQPEDRMAAAGYGGGNVVFGTENWAGGYSSSMTIDTLQGYWADYWHMLPMTDPNYQEIGAGVSVGTNGEAIYIVHAAYYAGGTVYNTPIPGVVPTTEPIQYVEPVVTATPNSDGAIIHRVAYGQTLFSIALSYGVSIDQLKTLNSLSDNIIYVGQDIIVKIAPTATITPNPTATRKYPTRTPTMAQATLSPTAFRTRTPTLEAELAESMPRIDRQWIGLGLLLISAIGLFVVLFFAFIKSGGKKSQTLDKPVEEKPEPVAVQKKTTTRAPKAKQPTMDSDIEAEPPMKKTRKPATKKTDGESGVDKNADQ